MLNYPKIDCVALSKGYHRHTKFLAICALKQLVMEFQQDPRCKHYQTIGNCDCNTITFGIYATKKLLQIQVYFKVRTERKS